VKIEWKAVSPGYYKGLRTAGGRWEGKGPVVVMRAQEAVGEVVMDKHPTSRLETVFWTAAKGLAQTLVFAWSAVRQVDGVLLVIEGDEDTLEDAQAAAERAAAVLATAHDVRPSQTRKPDEPTTEGSGATAGPTGNLAVTQCGSHTAGRTTAAAVERGGKATAPEHPLPQREQEPPRTDQGVPGIRVTRHPWRGRDR